jgi:hypothetical protein
MTTQTKTKSKVGVITATAIAIVLLGAAAMAGRFLVKSPANFKVISPNGGEKLVTGQKYAIKWSAPSNIDRISIEWSGSLDYIASGISSNEKSFEWTVPDVSKANNDKYLINIKGYKRGSGFPSVMDESDGLFTIVPAVVTSTTISPTTTTIISTTDKTPPRIVNMAVAPTTINTASQDATITLNITLADDMSGVCIKGCGSMSDIRIEMSTATGYAQTPVRFNTYNFKLLSGDNKMGSYRATVVIPKESVAGAWRVVSALVSDNNRNIKSYLYSDLKKISGMGNLDFMNNGMDINKPQLVSMSITPAEIDTTNQNATLTLNASLLDDFSGICIKGDTDCKNKIDKTILRLYKVNGDNQYVTFDNFKLVSGDRKMGSYTANAVMSKGLIAGAWRAQLIVVDKAGNINLFDYDNLKSISGIGNVEVMNKACYFNSSNLATNQKIIVAAADQIAESYCAANYNNGTSVIYSKVSSGIVTSSHICGSEMFNFWLKKDSCYVVSAK